MAISSQRGAALVYVRNRRAKEAQQGGASFAGLGAVGAVEDFPPVRAERLDAELGDRHADDRRQRDGAGWQVSLAEVERWDAAADAGVGVGDEAPAGRVPGVGEDHALVAIDEPVGVV